MPPEDVVRLRHMLEAADQIAAFISGRNRADFDQDTMLLFAVVRALEILGEAASKVSPPTRAESPAIPWSLIVGMRNRIVHAYFDVDPEVVWKAASEEVPGLVPHLHQLLSRQERE